jgi:hypothetical protein
MTHFPIPAVDAGLALELLAQLHLVVLDPGFSDRARPRVIDQPLIRTVLRETVQILTAFPARQRDAFVRIVTASSLQLTPIPGGCREWP